MNLHIIMHEIFEAPAAILNWATSNNCPVTFTRLYLGETFPDTVNDFDYLIIMGGPQCPDTTSAECPHFDSSSEIKFIQKAIKADKYLLGICLGAQLIGEALGAKYDHSPNREIGVFDLQLTNEAKTDPFFSTLPKTFPVGHWHGDMPGLTPTSQVLAVSEGCPRQIVKYSPKIYGFQCHFEFTPDSIEGMIVSCAHELESYKELPYIQPAEVLRNHDYNAINQKMFDFLSYTKSEYEKSTQ